MLKKKVIDAALEKVLADEDLTLAAAIDLVAKEKHQEECHAYHLHYGKFITTVGRIHTLHRKDYYIELARQFVEFLRKNKLLEETVAVPSPAPSPAGYKPDEFDFSDWDAIKRSTGF